MRTIIGMTRLSRIDFDEKVVDQVQSEIETWSRGNFGNNVSKIFQPNPPELKFRSPFTGIVEEIGELEESLSIYEMSGDGGYAENIVDACGDILIYMCDFMARDYVTLESSPMSISSVFHMANTNLSMIQGVRNPRSAIVSAIGKLAHAVLKRDQGIRGMNNEAAYTGMKMESLGWILASAIFIGLSFCDTAPMNILTNTWEGVKERNWKKNAANGSVAQQAE